MCHVQQRPSGVSLNTHVPGLCQSSQRPESTGPRNLCLVLLVGGQVGNTADGVTLHLHVGRQHLSDEWGQATEVDNQNLVIS